MQTKIKGFYACTGTYIGRAVRNFRALRAFKNLRISKHIAHMQTIWFRLMKCLFGIFGNKLLHNIGDLRNDQMDVDKYPLSKSKCDYLHFTIVICILFSHTF